jgi:hypothetical protein
MRKFLSDILCRKNRSCKDLEVLRDQIQKEQEKLLDLLEQKTRLSPKTIPNQTYVTQR